jgi:hypothetical protein
MPDTNFNQTIVLGSPISYKESDAFFIEGSQMANGWKLFVDWVNNYRGGLRIGSSKALLELVYIEDFSNTTYVKQSINYLLNDYNVDIILGPYTSKLTAASIESLSVHNMLQVAPGAAVTDIFLNQPQLFGTLPRSPLYSEIAFKTFSSLGAHSIGVISDLDHPLCNQTIAQELSLKYNITLAAYKTMVLDSTTYGSSLKDILVEFQNKGIETILGCTYTTMCLQVLILYRNITKILSFV